MECILLRQRAVDQAKRMKDLERENVRLKRLVADLSLEKQVLKDVASGNL
jgi:cell division protein FtsB